MESLKPVQALRLDIEDPELPGSAADMPVSPCIQVCRLDEHQVCTGCRRTLREIAAWPRMSRREKAALLEALAQRRL